MLLAESFVHRPAKVFAMLGIPTSSASAATTRCKTMRQDDVLNQCNAVRNKNKLLLIAAGLSGPEANLALRMNAGAAAGAQIKPNSTTSPLAFTTRILCVLTVTPESAR